MQHLIFETAWQKTIDRRDKQQITEVFERKNTQGKFIPLWQARNHRGDLLVTVIVQNFGGAAFPVENFSLTYAETGQPVASHTFSYSGLTIAPKSSMPWTFIFPKNKVIREPCLEEGCIWEDK